MTNFILLLALAAAAFGFRYWSRRRTRERLLATALSDRQRAIVAGQVPLVRRLPRELRARLDGKINLFLRQVEFIGCNGLKVTEEMRLSIAAQACLLIVNSDTWYEHLGTVLIYPGAFTSRETQHDGYIVTERETVRTGTTISHMGSRPITNSRSPNSNDRPTFAPLTIVMLATVPPQFQLAQLVSRGRHSRVSYPECRTKSKRHMCNDLHRSAFVAWITQPYSKFALIHHKGQQCTTTTA